MLSNKYHQCPVQLSLFPQSPSNCLFFNICPVPERLYVCSCCHRPLCHTQRAWVHSSFGSIHKKQWCINQALPPVPGPPRDHPSGSDSRDIDQKLPQTRRRVEGGASGWVGRRMFGFSEWRHGLGRFSSLLFPFLDCVISSHPFVSRFCYNKFWAHANFMENNEQKMNHLWEEKFIDWALNTMDGVNSS